MNQSGEIVVYRNDKSIVLYNHSGQIRALTSEDINLIQNSSGESTNNCPFCGSILTGEKYNYVAKAYFYLLQNSFQNFSNTPQNYSYCDTNINLFNNNRESLSENYENNLINGQTTGSIDPNNSLDHRRRNSYGTEREDENEIIENDIIEMPKNIPKYLLITGYYKRFFIEGPKLGSGSYGHVFNCIHILDELILGEYAVKKLPIGDDMEWLKRAIKEIKIRENIRHKNVVDYNHSWLEMYRINELCPYIPYLFILMEYCNGGNLYNYIQSIYKENDEHKGSISEQGSEELKEEEYLKDDEVMALFVDILSGLDYLHKNFIIHRDLKPSNILLKFLNKSTTAIISDFGTCEIFSQKSSKSGFTGTIEYTAPELLMRNCPGFQDKHEKEPETRRDLRAEGRERSIYSSKVDVWSLGVVLYYMSYGKLPFYSEDIKTCIQLIVEGEVTLPPSPKRCNLIQSLILNLLSKNSKDRMDCDDMLNVYEINKFLINNEYNDQIRNSLYLRFKHSVSRS